MNIRTVFKVASAAFFVALSSLAQAQNSGTVTSHAFAVGRGAGVTGYTSLLCTSAQLAVGQASADPICQTITGDVTISAGGVTAIGATVVHSSMLNADVFSTAHSWAGQQTFTAPVLGTPASGTLTNATGLPISTGVSGLATGVATFLATPSSANLRAALTDEVGTGAAYFVGGALGTPASGTATNLTGLPVGGIAAIGANTAVVNATSGSASPTAFAMPSCSTASSALTWTTNTGFGCNSIAGAGSVIVPPTVRLTLTQGTAATTSDVTGATSVYLEPFGGGYQIQIYDGVSAWSTLNVAASTYGLPATQSQTGTTHTNTTIDGLTDTSQLVIGMQVTGTNVAASTTISAIPTSTSITVNNATTGSATNTMTFKLPPSTNYDVYVQNNGGVPRMIWSAAWSTDILPPTRVLQNGILVQSGVTTNRLLGSARTTSIAGQLEDSVLHAWLSNIYNPQPRKLAVVETANSWNWATTGWHQANASTANQVDVLFSVAAPIALSVRHMFQVNSATPTNSWSGIGVDSTSVSSSTLSIGGTTSATANTIVNLASEYEGTPGIGRHFFPWLEFGATNGIFTGTAGTIDGRAISGMAGWATH